MKIFRLFYALVSIFKKQKCKKISLNLKGERIYLKEARTGYVKDGDTVDVWIGEEKKMIRLYGIDCPEDDQPWGDTATAGLIKLIGGRNVFLEMHGEDSYGRTLATIYIKDGEIFTNVNEMMIVKGHAWVMRMFYKKLILARKAQLNRLEYRAKKHRAGLWKENNPTPPWKWRHGK
ncbi:MAG: thermonuclease family protein [Halobacteriovoraceae bacterium]|nr:thermonuclease family protein [Halobacteriovoraceae bacterium]